MEGKRRMKSGRRRKVKKKEVEEGTSHSPEATHAQVSLSPEGAETLWLVSTFFFNLIFLIIKMRENSVD